MQLREAFTSKARYQKCSICGSGLRPLWAGDPTSATERAIDTGIFIDFEGQFEICEHCGVEIARLVGYIAPTELAEVLDENEQLREALHTEQAARQRKEQVVQVLSQELGESAREATNAELAYRQGYEDAFSAMEEVEVEEPDFG
jgi:hypothetical protein